MVKIEILVKPLLTRCLYMNDRRVVLEARARQSRAGQLRAGQGRERKGSAEQNRAEQDKEERR